MSKWESLKEEIREKTGLDLDEDELIMYLGTGTSPGIIDRFQELIGEDVPDLFDDAIDWFDDLF